MRARSSSLSSLLVLPLVNGLVMQRTVTGSTDRCAAIDVEENQVSLTYPDLYIGDSRTSYFEPSHSLNAETRHRHVRLPFLPRPIRRGQLPVRPFPREDRVGLAKRRTSCLGFPVQLLISA